MIIFMYNFQIATESSLSDRAKLEQKIEDLENALHNVSWCIEYFVAVLCISKCLFNKNIILKGLSWPPSYGSWTYNYLCNQCLSPLMLWVRILIRARCTTLCDKVCQWLATGRWCSPGPPVSSTNKTDHHDIHVAEILLKVALNTTKQTTSNLYLEIFRDIDFFFFYVFHILIWNCSNSVVCFLFSILFLSFLLVYTNCSQMWRYQQDKIGKIL